MDFGFFQILTFGAFGSVIGHEILHGFDAMGRKYDANGKVANWWSKESAENFKKKAQCMVDQYSQYTQKVHYPCKDTHSMQEIPVSGKLTLNENIGDNGGINLAYRYVL